MTKQEVIKKLNKVGEDFGWQMGKVGANYENGYMQAVRDCKAAFYKDDVITNADKVRNMSDEELAKFIGDRCIKIVGEEWCIYHNCDDCMTLWLKESV